MKSPTAVFQIIDKTHDIRRVEFDSSIGLLTLSMGNNELCEEVGNILEGQLIDNVEGRNPISYSFKELNDTTITVKGVNTALVKLIKFLVTEYRDLLPDSVIERVEKAVKPNILRPSLYSTSGKKEDRALKEKHIEHDNNGNGNITGCAML